MHYLRVLGGCPLNRAFKLYLFLLKVGDLVILIIVIILLLVLFFLFKIRSKKLKLPNVCLITGAVKTGKTTLAVHLAIKKYKSQFFKYKLSRLFGRRDIEKPLLYSNIRLRGIDFVPLTKELLMRQTRFAYGSVVLISEGALVADSQNFKDSFVNESLTLYCKLFGHETHGGFMFVETQNITDLHYSFKRVCNSFLWIQSSTKFPFVIKMQVRELIYSAENSSTNVFNEDAEKTTLNLYLFKSIWKRFDSYCYSIFTDDLPIANDTIHLTKNDSLKSDSILQVREFQYLKGGDNNE